MDNKWTKSAFKEFPQSSPALYYSPSSFIHIFDKHLWKAYCVPGALQATVNQNLIRHCSLNSEP